MYDDETRPETVLDPTRCKCVNYGSIPFDGSDAIALTIYLWPRLFHFELSTNQQ